MSKTSGNAVIRLRGVRQNNLKNIDLDLPLGRLIVVTGLSGSGKSSLAFETLFAEGQRRYIETFSPYARQFFDRMDKPAADLIEGIPPAIAIEQRNAVRTTRSTVGTMTEICEHMKLLWPHIARLHCSQCGVLVQKDNPQRIWASISETAAANQEFLVTFDLKMSEKLSTSDSLALVSRQGYQRLIVDEKIVRVEEAQQLLSQMKTSLLTVIQDRIKITSNARARFVEACEQAYHFGKGRLAIRAIENGAVDPKGTRLFSSKLHCAACDIEYQELGPAYFSFNHPLGACPACRGFGRIITIDYTLALPDRTKTLAEGVVKPWQSGKSAECQEDMMAFCKKRKAPTNVPFNQLPAKWQEWVIEGDPDYGIDTEHSWPHRWYGIKGYFKWLESKSYKMHVRVLLSRYRAYTTCPNCRGARLKPESLNYKLPDGNGGGLTLADFYRLPLRDSVRVIESILQSRAFAKGDPMNVVLGDTFARLSYLTEVGLGYLTLDRPTRTLSGGETERVNLTACLGTRLVNTLFVLDEPSVGLHPRDTKRLVKLLSNLRDTGNTVLVVEHEPEVMRAADHIVDLGPGHGETGGAVVFQGSYNEILQSGQSLTGQYLSGAKTVPTREPRAIPAACPRLRLEHATAHNLKDLNVEIPLGRFVCVTGVSGSGKTTLVREVLLPLLTENLGAGEAANTTGADHLDESDSSSSEDDSLREAAGGSAALTGAEVLGRVVLVDQSALGKTPRSTPAVYTGAFEDLRQFFAKTDEAKRQGLKESSFSFNSRDGQCERCRGAGFEKIEMQFLSDVFIRCPDCQGRRYRSHILEIKVKEPRESMREWSIADMLEASVDAALDFLSSFPESKPALQARSRLQLLQEVGLGYLRLGQPINTLSGGESQRLKLVRHLAEFAVEQERRPKGTLFLFDEPTTGLHYDDVRILLQVFHRLVDAGHSVVVIEHNLDVIKTADWLIDMGPEAGDEGGKVVVCGTPAQVARCAESHTGAALKAALPCSEKE